MILEFPRVGIQDVKIGVRMIWSGTIQQHVSLREGRLSYCAEPVWEFDLQYNGLREGSSDGLSYDELSQFEGLFGLSAGTTQGFRYYNKRRNKTFRQALGTTDGATSALDLLCTYGPRSVPSLQGTEHIGLLFQDEVPFTLYIDGSPTPVAPSDPTYGYTLNTATPGKQQLVWNSAPAAGHTVQADYGFEFYARFLQSPFEYDKFAENLYEAEKITLRTLRSESR